MNKTENLVRGGWQLSTNQQVVQPHMAGKFLLSVRIISVYQICYERGVERFVHLRRTYFFTTRTTGPIYTFRNHLTLQATVGIANGRANGRRMTHCRYISSSWGYRR